MCLLSLPPLGSGVHDHKAFCTPQAAVVCHQKIQNMFFERVHNQSHSRWIHTDALSQKSGFWTQYGQQNPVGTAVRIRMSQMFPHERDPDHNAGIPSKALCPWKGNGGGHGNSTDRRKTLPHDTIMVPFVKSVDMLPTSFLSSWKNHGLKVTGYWALL
jgi:hypothetical protein